MTVETFGFISNLSQTYPAAGDVKSEGDDHIRGIKSTLKAQFPNLGAAAVTPTAAELNRVAGVTSAIQTQLDSKAALVSPEFTGAPTAPTAAGGSNNTVLANTAYVDQSIAAMTGGAVSAWVSGTTYAIGNVVYSPINFANYRKKTSSAGGTVDPSLNQTDWAIAAGDISPPMLKTETITTSGTWVAPVTGWYSVTVVGGGGSGGCAHESAAAPATIAATGGGAGGLARKRFFANASDSFAVTIGAGGTGVFRNTAGQSNGVAGGATTFVGGTISITANGGGGGFATKSVVANAVASGATGGTASGGDENLTGGGSGIATANYVASYRNCAATGGGAVNFTGTAYSSGYATAGGGAGNAIAVTGGAGTGGASGFSYATNSQQFASGGGGAGGPSAQGTVYSDSEIIGGPAGYGPLFGQGGPVIPDSASGAISFRALSGGPGGGMHGCITFANDTNPTKTPFAFSASGGGCHNFGGYTAVLRKAGIGSGGGGMVCGQAVNATSSAGGSGCVILEY